VPMPAPFPADHRPGMLRIQEDPVIDTRSPAVSFHLAWRACLVAMVSCAASTAQRIPDVRLDTLSPPGATGSHYPGIATSGSAVYVAWVEGDLYYETEVYFNRSLDRGAEWLARPIRLDTIPVTALTVKPRNVQIGASGSAVYAVWADNRAAPYTSFFSDVYFTRSLDRGATWLASEVRLNTGATAGSNVGWLPPRMAADGASVFVTWTEERVAGRRNVFFNRSLDSGTTWLSRDVQLNTSAPRPGAANEAEIACSGSRVFVTWYDDRNGSNDIYFNRSLDGGTTWLEADVRLDTGSPPGAAHSFRPQIAAVGSSVFVVWDDSRNGGGWSGPYDIYFNRSLDGGATWLPTDIRLDTSPWHSVGSCIAAAGTAVYVAWLEDGPPYSPYSELYFNRSVDSGTTWLATEVRLNTGVPPGTTWCLSPRIAAEQSSVFVTWFDGRNTTGSPKFDVFFNRSVDRGATWPADVRLDTGSPPGQASSTSPVMAAAHDGGVYVVWLDDRGRSSYDDVYFNVPFGWLPYGDAKAGTGGAEPALSAPGQATMGGAVSLAVTHGLGGAAGALFLGNGPASRTSLSLFGGTVLVQPTVTVPIVLGGPPGAAGTGTWSSSLSIPNHAALAGANFNFQAILLDGGATFGLSMSNAVELWIG